MPRKNGNVRRSNDRGRLVRQAKAELPMPPTRKKPRLKIEEMVLPEGRCGLMNPRKPKARFATQEIAERALRQAQQSRARSGTGHVEKRVYRCPEGGCGGWHLTSREAFDDTVRKTRLETRKTEDDRG